MPLVFSYGTLRQEAVQLQSFGRLLTGSPDVLTGFANARVPIEDQDVIASSGQTHHANAEYSGNPQHQVKGVAFELTDDELASADDYESRADYIRIEVTLASGRRSWVYVHEPSAPHGSLGGNNQFDHGEQGHE